MAKLIFIVNKIPESNDQSYDYFRRWIMLFEKTFQGVDTSLIEELTTEEELLGLSNPAIFFLQAPIKHKIVAKILSSKRSNGLGISCLSVFSHSSPSRNQEDNAWMFRSINTHISGFDQRDGVDSLAPSYSVLECPNSQMISFR